ncbi:MAG: hypothetical protein ACRC3J_09225 [Culicoidibacterales bacterium]
MDYATFKQLHSEEQLVICCDSGPFMQGDFVYALSSDMTKNEVTVYDGKDVLRKSTTTLDNLEIANW